MDVYKEFIQLLRRKALEDVYLFIIDDTSLKLKHYIRLIINVPFTDGAYHTYYGEIKKIVNSFMVYITLKTDEIYKEANRLTNVLDYEQLMELVRKTISIHQTEQIEFGKEYLPITTPSEKQNYEDIEKKYSEFMEKLFRFAEELEKLNSKTKTDKFSKDYFEIPMKKAAEVFEFAEVYVSMMLSDRLYQMRVSIEEISLRLHNNLREVKEKNEECINELLQKLYDKNKEQLAISRRFRRSSTEHCEVLRSMEIIRSKIEENYGANHHVQRLEKEIAYFDGRLKDFYQIADSLTKLKAEEGNMVKLEEEYKSMRTIELPGTKYGCWMTMGQNISERKEYLKLKIVEVAKALRTHLACKGIDRIYYVDKLGTYYLDEFNHQVYVTDYAMKTYHIDCEGRLKPVTGKNEYYFDESGRYTIDNGDKTYQCAPCTSQYKLDGNLLLEKVTKDCGHSEMKNEFCKLDIKDPNIVEILPSTEPVDIKKTLDSEVVKYLWDSFGAILPEALHDVATARPMNPIHYLAHKLLYHKYRRTSKELTEKYLDAELYRTNIYKQRHEKAVAVSKAWKAKQVKRRKPEESDDGQNQAIYQVEVAQQYFIDTFNSYND